MRNASEKLRALVIVEPLEQRCLLSVDVTPPTVRFVLHSFMTAPQWIAVTYKDETDLNFGSVGRTDIRVVGPNGFNAVADNRGWISSGPTISSPDRLKYGIPAPGGSWDPADNGRYKISLTRPVQDASGNRVRSLNLGYFDVLLSGTGRLRGHVNNDDPQGMKGVRVYVDANDDSTFNSGEASVLSNTSGLFVLELPVGSYRIREVAPAGFELANSLPPKAQLDDPGTGGAFDVEVKQSTVTDAGSFINSLDLVFLDVNGTDANDQITVLPDPSGVRVTINGVSDVRSLAGINTLRVHGGKGDDVITIDPGIQLAARIFGDGGDDTLRGGDSGGTIRGGDGADEIFGGAGNDSISGGNELLPCGLEEFSLADAADTIRGGNGDDSIYGGNGNDRMFGGGGNDRIRASSGAATIRGGDGDDIIHGLSDGHMGDQGDGNKMLHGDAGNDLILGGDLSDRLFGEAGNDTLNGGSGADKLYGGSGDDVLVSNESNWVHDFLYGASGLDKADVDGADSFSKVERVKEHQRGDGAKSPARVCYSSECFLTTAVVHWAGKTDDCHELTVLRRFRDEYMRQLPQGSQMIRDYYQHAPRVVQAMEEQQRGEEEWPKVYAMVREAVELIEAGHNREALELYAAEYLRLRQQYVGAAIV